MKLAIGSRARWFKVGKGRYKPQRVPVVILRPMGKLHIRVRREDDGTEHKVRAENLMPA